MQPVHSYVRVAAVRWIDDAFPRWVEVHLRESDGTVAVLVDKSPVFDPGERLVPVAEFPVELAIPCEVLHRVVGEGGDRSSVIRLKLGIEDTAGRGTFCVDDGDLVTYPA